jgi:RNA polymerase sigma-70 factor (ECF subfamily)
MAAPQDNYTALGALLLAGLAGDNASYAHFLRDITPILRRVIARRIIDADVEDVLQEVLISVHKARHTYDGARPVMPWIIAIARFRITDHLRKHYTSRRHQTVDISTLENILIDVTGNADDRESIDDLLHDVPTRQRTILTLMHVEGYTAKQVGERLNMKESAVKIAAHRAVKQIRKAL